MKVRDRNRIPAMMRALPKGIVRGLNDLEDGTLEQIDDGFEAGTNAMGEAWQPLHPRTVQLKGHARILRDTEEMRNAFKGDVDAETYTLEIAVDNWKAQYHEFGAADANIPRRSMVRPAARWVEHQGMDDHFETALRTMTGAVLLTSRGVG